ncbi:MAG: hypothetical protein ACRDY6_07060, partial [Acidimicrobiia bacterium]
MQGPRLGPVLLLVAIALVWPTVGSAVGGDEPEMPTTTTGPDGEAQAFEGTLIEAGEPVEGVTIGVE